MEFKLKISTIILIIGSIVGLSLLLYPTFSDYWNEKHSTHAIASYVTELENVDKNNYQEVWEAAVQYNKDILTRDNPFSLTEDLEDRYKACLDVTGTTIMGYIEIPKIDVALPIYHGVSDAVLQMAIGHLPWSSLPTGGESTHCVVSGHRGLTSAKLFTDLDKLREGDMFTVTVLSEMLTYEVDQIRVVEPIDLSELRIEEGKDYFTLVTCTPYGVNTHRLLVRGHRIETSMENVAHVVQEAVLIDPLIVAPIVAFPFLFTLLMMVMLKRPEKIRTKEQIIDEIKSQSK